jgi:hypothetical protein
MDLSQGRITDVEKEIKTKDTNLLLKELKINFNLNSVNKLHYFTAVYILIPNITGFCV